MSAPRCAGVVLRVFSCGPPCTLPPWGMHVLACVMRAEHRLISLHTTIQSDNTLGLCSMPKMARETRCERGRSKGCLLMRQEARREDEAGYAGTHERYGAGVTGRSDAGGARA